MNPFVTRMNKGSWEIPVSALCLILGVMISMAWINEKNRSSRIASLEPSQASRVNAVTTDANLQAQYAQLSSEVGHLRLENTRMENALAGESKQGQVLNQSLQEVKLFAGLTDVEGPGIAITLRDSNKPLSAISESPLDRIIHDTDVLKVVNELWASDAQAITVNNHRVAGGTSFRCVGPTICVNGAKIASPVIIRAIGEPDTLQGGIDLPGGVFTEMRSLDPSMVQIEQVKKLHFPAFTGQTTKSLLTVPKETK